MAIDPQALTLAEWAHMSNDPLVMKITESLHKTLNILQDIPMVTADEMTMQGVRYIDSLPTVTWGKINQAPTVTKGKPTPYEEQVALVRNQFQVDKRLVNNKNNIESPIQSEVDIYMEALTFELNFRFIQNNPTLTGTDLLTGLAIGSSAGGYTGLSQFAGNSNSWLGLAYRLSPGLLDVYGIPSEMLINGGSFEGGAVDLSITELSGTGGADVANTFIEAIQQMLDYMNAPEGDGVVFYCNDLVKRRWERAIRKLGAGGGFDITRDAFDRPVACYKNAKIRDVGRAAPLANDTQATGPNQSYRIISSNETANGTAGYPGQSGADYTSIYAVRYGDTFFKGWQTNPLKPENLGIDPTNGIMINVVVDWGAGLFPMHNRCMCRMYGINVVS